MKTLGPEEISALSDETIAGCIRRELTEVNRVRLENAKLKRENWALVNANADLKVRVRTIQALTCKAQETAIAIDAHLPDDASDMSGSIPVPVVRALQMRVETLALNLRETLDK